MMKRVSMLAMTLLTVALVMMLLMSVLAVSPASAVCRKVVNNEVSSWDKRSGFPFYACKESLPKVNNPKNNFTKTTGNGSEVEPKVLCYRVERAAELSGYEDKECKKPKAGEGLYIRVVEGAKEEEEGIEPGLLPEPTKEKPVSFTDKSGKNVLETVGGKKVECEKDTSTDEATSFKLGTFKVTFEGCKSEGFNCTGLSDTAGNISVEGEVHLWYGFLKKEETLHTAIVFLLKHVHFTCFIILILVLGCAAGSVKETNQSVNTLTVELAQEKGKQDIGKVLNEKREIVACELKLSANEGAEEQTGEQAVEEAEKFKQGGKEINVEIDS
jgi:hypothetical protein